MGFDPFFCADADEIDTAWQIGQVDSLVGRPYPQASLQIHDFRIYNYRIAINAIQVFVSQSGIDAEMPDKRDIVMIHDDAVMPSVPQNNRHAVSHLHLDNGRLREQIHHFDDGTSRHLLIYT